MIDLTLTTFFEHHMSNQTKIKVYIRFRPFNKKEIQGKAQGSCAFHKNNKRILLKNGVTKQKEFEFEHIFNVKSTQEDVFREIGPSLVNGKFDRKIL